QDLFWWLTRLGFMRVNGGSRLGRRLRARGEFVIGTNRRQLHRAGIRFRPAWSRHADTPHGSPTAAAWTSAW
ncbi:MAG: hypothetical protein WCG47_17685, partial [Dermatophilaceae bacterium]